MAILKQAWRMRDLSEIAADRSSYTSEQSTILRVSRETGNSVFVAMRVVKPDQIDIRLTGEFFKDWNAVNGPVERLWKNGASFTVLVRNGSNDLVVVWKRETKK